MNKKYIILLLLLFIVTTAYSQTGEMQTRQPGLKDAFGEQFLIGAALNTRQSSGRDTAAVHIIKQHFNTIVAENCMKCEVIHPEKDRYDFTLSDQFVDFGEQNGLTIIGHCLIWHSQLAPWFYMDEKGKDVSPEVLKQRMKDHIYTIVGRYKGRIKGWDVVNEAILDNGAYRESKFYQILGEEFIPLAFQYAHEADPDAELYYNDYGMDIPGRRDAVVKLIRKLKERGLRIDAVGMQGHMGMDYPCIDSFEKSMLAFASTGLKVMITEWDMSALPAVTHSANVGDTASYRKSLNPYPDGLPLDVSEKWNKRMKEFFMLFVKHADIVERVTTWGVSDSDSWKNDFPIHGRTDYPLLFDRQHLLKPFMLELIEEKNKTSIK